VFGQDVLRVGYSSNEKLFIQMQETRGNMNLVCVFVEQAHVLMDLSDGGSPDSSQPSDENLRRIFGFVIAMKQLDMP